MNRIIAVLLFFLFCLPSVADAEESAMYRLQLTDKGNPPYRIDEPEKFLSQKSIDRRIKQGLGIDETDLPVDRAYFDALIDAGASIHASGKWLKTIVVNIPDTETYDKIAALPFVSEMTKVWTGDLDSYTEENPENETEEEKKEIREKNEAEDYGDALTQININNALLLHQAGYKGSGKTIAVMDAGFSNADKYPDFLDESKILGVKNFTHEKGHPYRNSEGHGTSVLSCMLANNPGVMIGTAPYSQFYLFKTEVSVNKEEYPVEEDYWVAALEYADSLGVDIVTTSLGYSKFDDPEMNHSWDDLDGYTVPASRAASMAASKGMVLFNAAGNEGASDWQKVAIPADAENILTVGAIGSDSLRTDFSSWGYIVDERVKPDVMAMGLNNCLLSKSGNIYFSKGTSFSTPVLAGMGACLWEALPDLTSLELMDLIKQFSDRSSHPDEYFGYGIPNIYEAYVYGKEQTHLPLINEIENDWIYMDSVHNCLYLKADEVNRATIYSWAGNVVWSRSFHSGCIDIGSLQKGIYILSVFSNDKTQVCKFIR
jgi:hypothetical protein